MKLKVIKHRWQFWLPNYLNVQFPKPPPGDLDPIRTLKKLGNLSTDLSGPGEAIEADEAEPWYGGDAEEAEDGGVVTAEPPIVYATRGNARMAEREKVRSG